jgi:hypothetical protein
MKKAYLLLLPISLFICTLVHGQAGYINTVAGSALAGYAGDGQQATDAKLDSTVQLIAVDDSANIYICDAENARIRKVYNATGVIATIAGIGFPGIYGDGGPATRADVAYPEGIAVDAAGNVYISDPGNLTVRKITKATGIISRVAGSGGYGYTGNDSAATNCRFQYNTGVAVDNSGNVYIGDHFNSTVRMVSAADSNIYLVAGNGHTGYDGDGGQATDAELDRVLGIALDNMGDLYIVDHFNYDVRKVILSSGIISTIAGIPGNPTYNTSNGVATAVPMSPTDIRCDASGNIYMADAGDNVIREITVANGMEMVIAGNGLPGFYGDGGPALDAEFGGYPYSVAVDPSNNVYVNDLPNFRIRKINAPALSVPEVSTTNGFGIYPNPATSMLNIVMPAVSHSNVNTIEIMDVTGKSIVNCQLSIVNSESTVDISTLASGMYFIKISNTKTSQVFKFVKE